MFTVSGSRYVSVWCSVLFILKSGEILQVSPCIPSLVEDLSVCGALSCLF